MELIYKAAGTVGTGLKDKKGTTVREGQKRVECIEKGRLGRRPLQKRETFFGRNRRGARYIVPYQERLAQRWLEIPEGGVWLIESEADVPSFVITPDDLCFGGAARFGMDEFDALAKRKRSTDDGHATGVTNVYGDAIGALKLRTFIPFDLKTDLRNDALVSAHFCPAVFDVFFDRTCDCSCCRHGLPRCGTRGVPGRGNA